MTNTQNILATAAAAAMETAKKKGVPIYWGWPYAIKDGEWGVAVPCDHTIDPSGQRVRIKTRSQFGPTVAVARILNVSERRGDLAVCEVEVED